MSRARASLFGSNTPASHLRPPSKVRRPFNFSLFPFTGRSDTKRKNAWSEPYRPDLQPQATPRHTESIGVIGLCTPESHHPPIETVSETCQWLLRAFHIYGAKPRRNARHFSPLDLIVADINTFGSFQRLLISVILYRGTNVDFCLIDIKAGGTGPRKENA